MDKQTALGFLEAHQPMPPDSLMSGGLIETYNEVRRYFIANPDRACIDLFLRSFGEGSGFGIYQEVDEVLQQYPESEVVPRLAVYLKSPERNVRYWCAEMAASFSDPILVDSLSGLLQEDDVDMRSSAITALFTIPDKRVGSILQTMGSTEAEPELQEQINDAIEYRREHNLDLLS